MIPDHVHSWFCPFLTELIEPRWLGHRLIENFSSNWHPINFDKVRLHLWSYESVCVTFLGVWVDYRIDAYLWKISFLIFRWRTESPQQRDLFYSPKLSSNYSPTKWDSATVWSILQPKTIFKLLANQIRFCDSSTDDQYMVPNCLCGSNSRLEWLIVIIMKFWETYLVVWENRYTHYTRTRITFHSRKRIPSEG